MFITMSATSVMFVVGVVLGSRDPAAAAGPPRVILCDSTSAAGGECASPQTSDTQIILPLSIKLPWNTIDGV